MGKTGSKFVLTESTTDGVQSLRSPAAAIEKLTTTSRMDVKWTRLGLIFFVMLSIIMTGCFLWQYHLPKIIPEEDLGKTLKSEKMCPRYPKPTPLEHPIPYLKAALEKVDAILRHSINPTSLPTISAIVIYNDTVLWTGNFGKRNGSDPKSTPPNEYTIYRASVGAGFHSNQQPYQSLPKAKNDLLNMGN